jgi:ring-1,2-phenylacetyl-CoA epoxidase subunit PaaE
MTSNSILSESDLEEGLVLSCLAHPTTEKITIDFDDV